MEDRSIIKPILDALEYFKTSENEINYFYNIIDKFCACWFRKEVNVSNFNNTEYFLIHELLGEYIRFEENNKRVALWLLTINRICYNYTKDLSDAINEISTLSNSTSQDIDSSLISPILSHLKVFSKLHENAGKKDRGESDIIANFIQWVMVYTTYIYPSLKNKLDFYDQTVIKTMNFILIEFIKQRSNDKRLAFLIMAIMEACKYYSLQNNIDSSFLDTYDKNDETVMPGTEEALVEKILNRLKDENNTEEKPKAPKKLSADEYIKTNFKNFISDLNTSPAESTSIFNKYSFELTNKFLTYKNNEQNAFIQSLYETEIACNQDVQTTLKNSLNFLSKNTKMWFNSEAKKLKEKKEKYQDDAIKKINSAHSSTKFNSAKLHIMVYLFIKLGIL